MNRHERRAAEAKARLLHPIDEAQHQLGDISKGKLYQIIKAGELKLVKIGSRSFITDEELRRYVGTLGG